LAWYKVRGMSNVTDGLLIIPAYNEAKNIGQVLKSILDMQLGLDVVVIDDGSKDKTRQYAEMLNVEVISHPFNLGYGCALQTGFKFSSMKNYKYVIQFDADGQHDPEDIPIMMQLLGSSDIDILIGSRFLGRGSFRTGFPKKVVISLMRLLIRVLTKVKVTDPTSGLKGLSKRAYAFYSRMGNFPNDYPDADIIIQMLRMGYKVSEVPINVVERHFGHSMHSGLKPFIYLMKILLSIMAILLREKIEGGGASE
jgi:glycosyltransferase involved in cell wall biosynthesis